MLNLSIDLKKYVNVFEMDGNMLYNIKLYSNTYIYLRIKWRV